VRSVKDAATGMIFLKPIICRDHFESRNLKRSQDNPERLFSRPTSEIEEVIQPTYSKGICSRSFVQQPESL
jgi:hypothetical protein